MLINMLTKKKIQYFKEKLEKEKEHLEKDMERVGKRNPKVPGDWELMPATDLNVDTADKSELADVFEELETIAAFEDKIEERLIAVNQAIERIKRGNYGICLVGKEQIEEKRLEINPAAKYCIKHAQNRT